ncbi:MAG: lytic transglycosylase domain-containing protein [Sphingobium sp.]|uniref:lytic transglycosylase domain-containing protein n=1 Tax=Sphingomonadales TaxID=204457 RepID=UPI001B6DBC7B|nr:MULTISPECIES: lytic transglycosylase domain-containing protein [Sphingomonadaceae]MBP8896887.1 lytic transglycosylase domain-containing protein [Sulfuritalea sp.]MCH4152721.1 lytic transglycosylase domain-containing protein [Sphingobium sp.]MCI1756949.1 lytic transglycosylase domain-containing protein [Sphingobium sp.]MCI2052446.1 lytic transglycosylase domain-containing protein [Sphingobium sp.]
MKLPKAAIHLCLVACCCGSAAAREVDILDFAKLHAVQQKLVDPQLRHGSPKRDVELSLRAHLEQSGLEHWGGTSPADGTNLSTVMFGGNFEVDQRLYRGVMPIIQQAHERGLGARNIENCESVRYAPTWWLPKEIESRRALNFDTVAAIACEFGLPTNLLDAVITQESGHKSWVISSAGAMGIMQIMPGTARLLGLSYPFNKVSNMRAGARYLRQQLDRFGRVDLALAAYNAGPERRALQRGYVPAIPETRNYVRTITTNWARLARLGVATTDAEFRGNVAMKAVIASGYRSIELVRYDGLNASNPM